MRISLDDPIGMAAELFVSAIIRRNILYSDLYVKVRNEAER